MPVAFPFLWYRSILRCASFLAPQRGCPSSLDTSARCLRRPVSPHGRPLHQITPCLSTVDAHVRVPCAPIRLSHFARFVGVLSLLCTERTPPIGTHLAHRHRRRTPPCGSSAPISVKVDVRRLPEDAQRERAVDRRNRPPTTTLLAVQQLLAVGSVVVAVCAMPPHLNGARCSAGRTVRSGREWHSPSDSEVEADETNCRARRPAGRGGTVLSIASQTPLACQASYAFNRLVQSPSLAPLALSGERAAHGGCSSP